MAILDKHSIESITQLAEAISNRKFSDAAMQIITPIVKAGTNPKDIAAKIEKYFTHLKKLIASKPKHITEASEIAFYAFNDYVQVHPFDGANGRLATLWMNIALVLCGFSSILLRLPKERLNKDSAYKKAIDAIDSNPQLLKQHIYQQLQKPDFADRLLEKAVIAQVLCAEAGVALEQENLDVKKIERLFLSKFRKENGGIFESMKALTEDDELTAILSTTPLYNEDSINKINLIVTTNNTRKAFESLLKQKLSIPNILSGNTQSVEEKKTIEPHELMAREIKTYLATSKIKNKAVAFLSALDKREYSKALRIVSSIDHDYEAEGLKLIPIKISEK